MRIETINHKGERTVWGEFGPGHTYSVSWTEKLVHPETPEEKRELYHYVRARQPAANAFLKEIDDTRQERIQTFIAAQQAARQQAREHRSTQPWYKKPFVDIPFLPRDEEVYINNLQVYGETDELKAAKWISKCPADYKTFYTPIAKDLYEMVMDAELFDRIRRHEEYCAEQRLHV